MAARRFFKTGLIYPSFEVTLRENFSGISDVGYKMAI
jgi:hypothetical protein